MFLCDELSSLLPVISVTFFHIVDPALDMLILLSLFFVTISILLFLTIYGIYEGCKHGFDYDRKSFPFFARWALYGNSGQGPKLCIVDTRLSTLPLACNSMLSLS